MSKKQLTPGPWKLKQTSQARLIGNFDRNGDGSWVASLPMGEGFENDADAALLCVAPDLLAALKEAAIELGAFVGAGAGPSTKRALNAALAAIAKAEGKD